MGGILTAGDLKAAILGVSSVEDFRRLGDGIISPPASTKENTPNSEVKSETVLQAGNGFDINPKGVEYTPEEAAQMARLRKLRDDLLHRKEMLAARSKFVGLLRPRAKGLVEKLKQKEPKGGWKDICGFDSRVSWSDEEFDEWRLSEAGKRALSEGTVEAMAASLPGNTDADGDTAMDGEGEDELASLARGVCTKKRCERHKQWVKVQQQDISFEETTADEDLAKYEEEARNVAESAVLRRWAEKENIPSGSR
jgi:COMPASS component SPP1